MRRNLYPLTPNNFIDMAQVADCTNILLSFLHDVGEDYTDNFIFPSNSLDEFTSLSNDLTTDDFLVDMDEPIFESDIKISTDVVTNISSSHPEVILSSPSRDEEEFQQSLHLLDFGNIDCYNAEDMFGPSGSMQVDGFLSSLSAEQQKRKNDSRAGHKRSRSPATGIESDGNYGSEMSTYKRSRASLNKTISSVCGMLKQYRAQKIIEGVATKKANGKRYRCGESIALAKKYLQALLGVKPTSPQELLKMSSPGSTLECKALSSMVESSQSKKAKAKLSAWMPASHQFPSSHTGIGQIAAASRAFNAGMNDILTPSVMSKLEFDVNVPSSSAMTSKSGDKLSSPFTWSTKGLVGMGYPKELEFHGLIRASFGDEGVTYCNVEFDACKVIREKHDHDMFVEETSPKSVASVMIY